MARNDDYSRRLFGGRRGHVLADAVRRPVGPWVRAWLRPSKGSAAHIAGVFLAVIVACVVASALFPRQFAFNSGPNLRVALQAIPDLGIVSVGVGVLMIAGEFDLSVGANYTLSAIVMASLVTQDQWSPFAAGAVALAIGTVIGLVNAGVTLLARIPSFIVTLGAGLFWDGFALYYHGATFLSFTPGKVFTSLMTGSLGPMQAEFLWFIGICIVAWLLVHRTAFGNHVYAAGDNARAAAQVGVKVWRVKAMAFACAGFCAALAGIVTTTRVSSIVPGQGDPLTLEAIAACVIGGVALTGGRGTVLGIFVGACILYAIEDVLLLLGAPGFYIDLFVGLVIVAAAVLNGFVGRRVTASA